MRFSEKPLYFPPQINYTRTCEINRNITKKSCNRRYLLPEQLREGL